MKVQTVPLRELCDVRIGRTPSRSDQRFWGGPGVWISISELNGGELRDSKEHISEIAMRNVMPPPVPTGTLLFSFKLSIGKMAVSAVPLYTNEAIAALPIRDPGRLDREYLRYALMATSGAAQTNHAVLGALLNKAKVEALPIPLMPIAEQRRVVDLLSRAENIVRMRREAEKKAKEIIPALFLDMFGDPATNPRGWETKPLAELVTFVSGGTPSKSREDYWRGQLPWVSPKDMKVAEIFDAEDHISDDVPIQTSLKRIPPGAILIVVRGMILIHTVPVAITRVPATVNQDMKALLAHGSVNENYLMWLLRVSQRWLLTLVTTAAHGTRKIDTARLEALQIQVPPKALQESFVQRVRILLAVTVSQSGAEERAERAFQSLLAGAFEVGM